MPFKKKNINIYLNEVFKQFVAIQDDDYRKSRNVFNVVFKEVKKRMESQCSYFQKYAKEVMFAGSVYDGIKISKLDEFDMDIVIRLPVSYKDGPGGIIIENAQPGYVKLKITDGFDNLLKQKDWEKCHKVTCDWRDDDKYLMQNMFRNWLHGIVQKTLTDMGERVTVNGVTYLVTYKESGPAYTLKVRNDVGNEKFELDIDLVPVIKFMHPRWPKDYRELEHSRRREWLAVPKPNKNVTDDALRNRCWRLSFQEFEKEIMQGCQQLKMVIRLVKKFRDSLGLNAIASYYIKTLFLWKVHKVKYKSYWENKLSIILRDMIMELHDAIKNKNIPYFWNENHNLIENLKSSLQREYTDKLMMIIHSIDANYVDQVVALLLTPEELLEFQNSIFYKEQIGIPNEIIPFRPSSEIVSKSKPKSSLLEHVSIVAQITSLNEEVMTYQGVFTSYEKLKELEQKYLNLAEVIRMQEERLKTLEKERGYKEKFQAVGKALVKILDDAEIDGFVPMNDSKPKKWRSIENEQDENAATKKAYVEPCSGKDLKNILNNLKVKSLDDHTSKG